MSRPNLPPQAAVEPLVPASYDVSVRHGGDRRARGQRLDLEGPAPGMRKDRTADPPMTPLMTSSETAIWNFPP